MTLFADELLEQERHETGWARVRSALLNLVIAVSKFEDECKKYPDEVHSSDIPQAVEAERDRLKSIVGIYGRG